jgi:tetratricopeptide (TPR) repeat protein
MFLQHRAGLVDRLRRRGGCSSAVHANEITSHIRQLLELAQSALCVENARHSPDVWAYIADAVHSELLLNVHAARATLLEAAEVFSGRLGEEFVAPILLARIHFELKHGGRGAALSAARDAIAGGQRHPSVVAAFIDLEVPAQRPKAAYTALVVWRMHAPEVYLSVAKVYFLAKQFDRAEDQVRKALELAPRCGDAHAMKYRLAAEALRRAEKSPTEEGAADDTIFEIKSRQTAIFADAVKAQPNSGSLWIGVTKIHGFGENVTLTGCRVTVEDALQLCAQLITFTA